MPSKKRRKPKSVPAAGSGAAAKQAAAPPEDAAAAAARREEQRRIWAQRKRAAERKPIPVALYAWLGGGGIAVVGVIVVAVLLLGGGGGDSAPVQTFVPDPRVKDLPVDQTEEVIADDSGQAVNPTFSKTTIVGKAGDVIEIRMPNVGSVAHNLHVAGEDNEYSDDPAADDWITFPQTVQPGETGILRLKIDTPGTYEYRCDFHPIQQVGNLILS